MTTRPGEAALGLNYEQRGHAPCNLVKIVRTDGVAYRFTDHDRILTFEGQQYLPVTFAGMSAERRQAGLRTNDQDMMGVIDGENLVIADMNANRFKGADVFHVVTDWRYPWWPIARHRKKIRKVSWNRQNWVAQLQGLGQLFERPSGGRFGGVATYTCPYKLGGRYCGVDVPAMTQHDLAIGSLVDNRMEFFISTASWSGGAAFDEDWFRDGEFVWKFGVADHTGNETINSTTLVELGAGWTPGEHVGKYLLVLDAPAGGTIADPALVLSNTDELLVFEPLATTGSPPFAATDYEIVPKSDKWNLASPVVYSTQTRKITLFFPTPTDIVVGERGHLAPGCDGTFAICKDKFANQINFGGMHLKPKPSDRLEVAQ